MPTRRLDLPTYLYGLTLRRSGVAFADLRGIGGTAVRGLVCGSLHAAVSTVSREAIRPTLAAVREHDQVLQRMVDAGDTVAAVRFGQQFDDDVACERHVTERATRLTSVLVASEGAVEMRVLLPTPDVPAGLPASAAAHPAGPGRAYLESLRRPAVTPNFGLREALGTLVMEERVEGLPQTNGFAFVHLVKRDDLDAYRGTLAAHPALAHARIVGPLALHTFAEPVG